MSKGNNWRVPRSLVLGATLFAAVVGALLMIGFSGTEAASAQGRKGPAVAGQPLQYSGTAQELLQVPVTGVYPGGIPPALNIQNPFTNDPGAVQRGMKDFIAFNCVGCHAPNGGGGMGPSLSDKKWIYGNRPANIFLSIYQGRAKGMPAWGQMLPSNVIWELVAYIQSISQDPDPHFGKTVSLSPPSPAIEQVPAQNLQTPQPWQHTEVFHNGQNPSGKP